MRKHLALAVLCLAGASSAQAALKLNVLGGLNFADYAISPSGGDAVSAKGGLSYGATVQFGLLPLFDLEAGVFSVAKKMKTEAAGLSYVGSSRGWEIPVLLRFNALPVLDLGAGVYYATLGDEIEISDSNVAAVPNGKLQRDKDAEESSDYGVKASARARLPLLPLTDFLVDLSYNFGLKDLGKGSGSTKTRDYAIMAGVSFGL